ncbi:hypothetical protein BDC45DRAFT_278692 [Circinella umbellata]|nr:hypothetical protein BDC45DRAFT_278692 [Circinella umbellata]
METAAATTSRASPGNDNEKAASLHNSSSRRSLVNVFSSSRNSIAHTLKPHKSSPSLSRTLSLGGKAHVTKLYNTGAIGPSCHLSSQQQIAVQITNQSTQTYLAAQQQQHQKQQLRKKSHYSTKQQLLQQQQSSGSLSIVRDESIRGVSSLDNKTRDRSTFKGVLDKVVGEFHQ